MKFSTYSFMVALCLASFWVHSSYATDLASPTPTPVLLVNAPPPPTPTPTPTALYSHGREPTDLEIFLMQGLFPLLNRWEVRITGEPTWQYNCHRWALWRDTAIFFDYRFIGDGQAPLTIAEYENYMEEVLGYEPCYATDTEAEIFAYTKYDPNIGMSVVTHSSCVYSGNATLRESKLGAEHRITHPPGALIGSEYGTTIRGYKSIGG